jgi:Holliday junction DNA helicase RuvA
MLSVMPPDRLRAAISGSDIAALTMVPGIGKKGAERMVLELRDKIGVPTGAPGAAAPAAPAASLWREQVTEALVGLGWSAKQADDAVTRVADGADGAGAQDGGTPNVSEMLRAALRELGR